MTEQQQQQQQPAPGAPGATYNSHDPEFKDKFEGLLSKHAHHVGNMIKRDKSLQNPATIDKLATWDSEMRRSYAVNSLQKTKLALLNKDYDGAARYWAAAKGAQRGKAEHHVTSLGDGRLVAQKVGPDGKPAGEGVNPTDGTAGGSVSYLSLENIDARLEMVGNPGLWMLGDVNQYEQERSLIGYRDALTDDIPERRKSVNAAAEETMRHNKAGEATTSRNAATREQELAETRRAAGVSETLADRKQTEVERAAGVGETHKDRTQTEVERAAGVDETHKDRTQTEVERAAGVDETHKDRTQTEVERGAGVDEALADRTQTEAERAAGVSEEQKDEELAIKQSELGLKTDKSVREQSAEDRASDENTRAETKQTDELSRLGADDVLEANERLNEFRNPEIDLLTPQSENPVTDKLRDDLLNLEEEDPATFKNTANKVTTAKGARTLTGEVLGRTIRDIMLANTITRMKTQDPQGYAQAVERARAKRGFSKLRKNEKAHAVWEAYRTTPGV